MGISLSAKAAIDSLGKTAETTAAVSAALLTSSITNGDTTHAPTGDAVFDALALKQGASADLAAIAALTPANDDIIQRKAGAWTNRTMAQFKADAGLTGLTAGYTNVGFINYNGTTPAAGQFDGSTTAPAATARLNYNGYLYANRFYGLHYGDGSNLTGIPLAGIAQSGASLNQVMTWNGTAWVPAAAAAGYTDENAMDAVAAMFAAGTHTNITFTYNDAGNAISATVTGGSYTNENAMDAIAAMIAAGTHTGVTITYNDAGDALNFTVTGGGGSGSGTAIGLASVSQAAHGFSVAMPIARQFAAWVQADRDAATTCADAMVSYIAPSDPYASSIVALLHMDGANGSTTITDQKGKVWTASGQAQLNTAQSKFGTASLSLDGAGDYITTPTSTDFGFGTGDFTVECFIYLTGDCGAGGRNVADFRTANGDNPFTWYIKNSGGGNTLGFYAKGAGTQYADGTSQPLTLNTWAHIAFCRQSGAANMFVNGVKISLSTTGTFTENCGTSMPARFGSDANGGSGIPGYMDEIRVTKGVARYSANFTPPTQAFSEVATGADAFDFVRKGDVTLTTAQWDARTGDSGGLVDGEYYFLSSTAGGITKTAPTSGIWQCLGKARSSTVLMFDPSMPVDLGAAGGGNVVGIAGPLTAAGTTLSLAGLNLAADEAYEMYYSLKNNTASVANVNAFYNGDTTVANYYEQYHYAAGGSNLTGVVNDALALVIDASGVTTGTAQLGPKSIDGKVSCDFLSRRGTPTNPGLLRIHHGRNVVGDLTQLDLVASQNMAVGSYFKVLRKTNTAVAAMPAGSIIQDVSSAEDTTARSVAAGTNFPFDNTIPQITEGVAQSHFDVAFTPRYANSDIELEFNLAWISGSGAGQFTVGLFQSGVNDALRAGTKQIDSAGQNDAFVLRKRVAAGSTATRTYSVRMGVATVTGYYNQGNGARYFGGAEGSMLTVREIKR